MLNRAASKRNALRSLATVLWLLMLAPLAPADALTDNREQQLEELTGLLQDNPELIDSLLGRVRRHLDQQRETRKALESQGDWLSHADQPVLGNPEGDRLLVVFTDYNCPQCKRLESVLAQATDAFEDLTVVIVLLPMTQPEVEGLNTNSAFYALEVWQQAPERFAEVHRRLMEHRDTHTAESLRQVAEETDTRERLDASRSQVPHVRRNHRAFTELGLRGTPGLVVGEEMRRGYIEYERLEPLLETAFD